jgi:hypothetical protein
MGGRCLPILFFALAGFRRLDTRLSAYFEPFWYFFNQPARLHRELSICPDWSALT